MPSRKKKSQMRQVEGNRRIVKESDVQAVITIAITDDCPLTFNRYKIKRFMGFGHYDTITKAISALGFNDEINLEQVKKVYALYKLLACFRGNTIYTRAVMAQVIKNNQHKQLLSYYNVDLDKEFNQKKDEYFRKDHEQFRRRNFEKRRKGSERITEIPIAFV